MTDRRALLLAVLIVVVPFAGAGADPRSGTERVETKARVVHPGGQFEVACDVEGRGRDEDVVVLGVFEMGGVFGKPEVLGRARSVAGEKGRRTATVVATVPARVKPGRLSYAAILANRPGGKATVSDPALLSKIVGELRTLDVTAAPNLATTTVAVEGVPKRGVPAKVTWGVARTSPGLVGPCVVEVDLVPVAFATAASSPTRVTFPLPEGLPEDGVLRGDASLSPAGDGAYVAIARIRYMGSVVTDTADDEMRFEVTVENRAESPASPPLAPVPGPPPGTGPGSAPGTGGGATPDVPVPPATPAPAPEEPTLGKGGGLAPSALRLLNLTIAPMKAAPGETITVGADFRNTTRFPDTRTSGRLVLVRESEQGKDRREVELSSALRAGAIGGNRTRRAEQRVTLPADLPLGRYVLEVRLGARDAPRTEGDVATTAPLVIEARDPGTTQPSSEPIPPPRSDPLEPTEPTGRAPVPAPTNPAPAPMPVPIPPLEPVPAPPLPPMPVPIPPRDPHPFPPAAPMPEPSPARPPAPAPLPPPIPSPLPARPPDAPRAARPNLVVTGGEAIPGEAAAGTEVRFEALVKNVGDGPCPASTAAFSLIRTKVKDPIALGAATMPAIGAGGEARAIVTLRLPRELPPARWSLLVRADAADAVAETAEEDNSAVIPGALLTHEPAAAGVDLVVRGVDLLGGPEIEPASTVLVRTRIANAGRDLAPSFEVALVLATRARPELRRDGWHGVISELARVTVPAGTKGGTEVARELEGTLPSRLAPGEYFLLVIADPSSAVPEVRREDDLLATPMRLVARAVLVTTEPHLMLDRGEVFPGEAFQVSATLRNDGNLASAPASISIVVAGTGPRRRDGLDVALVTLPLDPVKPGETRTLSLQTNAPPSLPRGRWRVLLRAVTPGSDPVDVAEATLGVKSGAPGLDLVAYDGSVVPAKARAGEGVRVTIVVGNLSDGRTLASTARLYYANGPVLQPIGDAPVPALAARQDVPTTIFGRVPREAPEGHAWLIARVDPDGRLPQADRDNDATWIPLAILGRYEREVRVDFGPLTREGVTPVIPGGPLDLRTHFDSRGAGPVDDADVEAVLVSPAGDERSLGRRALAGGVTSSTGLDWAERFVVPSDLAPGRYVLRLLLDPDHRLPWEGGDRAAPPVAELSLDVQAPTDAVDLSIVSLEVPGVEITDRRLHATAMILNRGPGVAPAFDAVLYLASSDESRPGLWLPLLARPMPGGMLLAGVQTRAQFEALVPDEVPAGNYRAVVVVDPEGRVDPMHPADNRLSKPIRLDAVVPGVQRPAPEVSLDPALATPMAQPGADVDLVVVDVRPVADQTTAGSVAEIRWRVATRRAPPGLSKPFRWVVKQRDANGAYAELMTSAPQGAPIVGGHGVGSVFVPVPADSASPLHLRLEVRPEGAGDLAPADNLAETEIVVSGGSAAASTGALTVPLPLVLVALTPGESLSRDRSDPATILVTYPADWSGAAILDVSLETGDVTLPLSEIDVPAGPSGAVAAVKARLRLPSTAAAGPATLVVTVRGEAGGTRSPLRMAVTVR